MTTIPTPVTAPELSGWLAAHVGDPIADDDHAARLLLDAFDLLTLDSDRSLNNPARIASCLFDTADPQREPWSFAPVTADQAARALHTAFRITPKPTDAWLLRLARGEMDTPLPVTRHQCPFCRRFTRADPRLVQEHMTRCWKNPGLRCCKTCIHHIDGSHPEDDEACTNPAGPEPEQYLFPVLHCPLWQPEEPRS